MGRKTAIYLKAIGYLELVLYVAGAVFLLIRLILTILTITTDSLQQLTFDAIFELVINVFIYLVYLVLGPALGIAFLVISSLLENKCAAQESIEIKEIAQKFAAKTEEDKEQPELSESAAQQLKENAKSLLDDKLITKKEYEQRIKDIDERTK